MSEQYKSEMLAAIHETALGLHEADVLDKMTMRMFDEMCLTPVGFIAADSGLQLSESAPRLPAS